MEEDVGMEDIEVNSGADWDCFRRRAIGSERAAGRARDQSFVTSCPGSLVWQGADCERWIAWTRGAIAECALPMAKRFEVKERGEEETRSAQRLATYPARDPLSLSFSESASI